MRFVRRICRMTLRQRSFFVNSCRCSVQKMSESLQCWFNKAEGRNVTVGPLTLSNISAQCCVNGITAVLNVFANAFVVFKLHQTRARQPVSSILLLFLASLDLLKGAVGQPLYILVDLLKYNGISNCDLRNIVEAILCLCLGYAFLLTTIVITSERFLAIIYPLYHRVYLLKKLLVYTCFMLLVAWAIVVGFFHTVWYFRHVYLVYFCIILFGLVYTVFVYAKIFSVSRNSQKLIIERGHTVRSRKPGPLNNRVLAKDDMTGYPQTFGGKKREGIRMDSESNTGKIGMIIDKCSLGMPQ